MNEDEEIYKKALVEVLTMPHQYIDIWLGEGTAGVTLDGHFDGSAMKIALRKLFEEGLIKEGTSLG